MTPTRYRYTRQPGERRLVLAITAVLLVLEVCIGLAVVLTVGLKVMQ